MNKKLLLLAVAAAWPLALMAAEIPPKAPEQAEWILTFSKGKGKPAAKPSGSPQETGPSQELVSRRVAKNGKVVRILETFTDGTTEESWRVDGVFFYEVRGRTGVYMLTPEAMNSPLAAPPSNPMALGGDFPELAWMQPSHLAGTEEVEGVKYAIYEMKKAEESETKADPTSPFLSQKSPEKPKTRVFKAWINAQTGLPVRFEDGDRVFTYSFIDPPDIPTSLPERFKTGYTSYLDYKNELARHKMQVR